MTAVADKLREAKALIEKRGHAKRAFQNRKGGVCSVGAIRLACTGSPYAGMWDSTVSKAVDYFLTVIGSPSVATWNDRKSRSKAEVLAAFDRAIELAESGQ